MKFLFWVRKQEDLFYIDELNTLSDNNRNFSYEWYTSREQLDWYTKWYVTLYLTEENVKNFEEFYICGMPAMVDACETRLKELGISEESIFSEKYT